MVAYGQQTITLYWWQSVLPGLAIAYTVLGFNFLGDGLRDIFDVEVQGGL
jgi:peptide/nickel transport system permease protein